MTQAEVLQMKRELITTTTTRGWSLVKKLAEDAVKQLERKAIDEENDEIGNQLRREAKAARKFLNDFLKSIEVAKSLETIEELTSTEDGDFFYEVAGD